MMGKDTCVKANTYCPVCRGITGTDCWHSASDFSIPRTDWKQVDELSALRTQNAELLAERAGVISQSKMHPSWLDKSKEEILDCLRFQGATTAALLNQTDEQAERIRELEAAIDEQMVAAHVGVFNAGDDPKIAIGKLMDWSQSVGDYFGKDELREQLRAELAEAKKDGCYENSDYIKEAASALKSMLKQAEHIKELEAEIARLRRGEFICQKCSVQKDDEHPEHDF